MRHGLLLALTLSITPLFAQFHQSSLELGAHFGISAYSGELSQHHLEVLEMHKAYGGFVRYNLIKALSLRLNFLKASLSGSDANYPTIQAMRERNLSFRTRLYELGILSELNFLEFGSEKRTTAKAYIFGGLAGFYFNPQALYQGTWYDLQPLGTEGQSKKYSRIALAIPGGFGFKIGTTRRSSFGVEVGLRKTFTDYLDDVSGKYPDIRKLGERNPMAAWLSYRTPEVKQSVTSDPTGKPRGEKGFDSYLFGSVHISITILK